MERGVPDCAEKQYGATYPSVVPILRFGWSQLSDFSHDLRAPNLAKGIGAVVGRIGVCGVVMNVSVRANTRLTD